MSYAVAVRLQLQIGAGVDESYPQAVAPLLVAR